MHSFGLHKHPETLAYVVQPPPQPVRPNTGLLVSVEVRIGNKWTSCLPNELRDRFLSPGAAILLAADHVTFGNFTSTPQRSRQILLAHDTHAFSHRGCAPTASPIYWPNAAVCVLQFTKDNDRGARPPTMDRRRASGYGRCRNSQRSRR
jgi:hypothetical protein